MFFINLFIFFFIYIEKCLKIYQLNIIKKIKKDYKKELVTDIKIFLRNKIKKKQQYRRERYKNLSDNEKKKAC